MTIRVGINGFGRIGRMIARATFEKKYRNRICVVGINDLGSVETNTRLLNHDSVHGRFHQKAFAQDGEMWVRGSHGPKIAVTAERNPARLPWDELEVDVVLECTGVLASRHKAAAHLDAGARKVLISAPAGKADLTVVYGVNDDRLEASHEVVSNASCTTNCLAPVAKALNDAIGIERGFMTTVHSYTGDQPVLDTLHKDPRRARAAAGSMIPTSTGAARAVGLVLPELKGRLDGTAIRVPTPNVSLIDFTFSAARRTSVAEINETLRDASMNRAFKQVLNFSDEPLVSADYNHDPASATVDSLETQVVGGRLGRVLAWYDNEWGFSNRMLDVAALLGSL